MDARYRLAPMRAARARDERVKRGELATAVRDAEALAASADASAGQVARHREAIAAARAEKARWLAAGATATALAHLDRYLQRLARALDAARGEQLRAEARHQGQLDAVDLARRQLAHARADREIIERHFAAWRAQHKQLAERRED